MMDTLCRCVSEWVIVDPQSDFLPCHSFSLPDRCPFPVLWFSTTKKIAYPIPCPGSSQLWDPKSLCSFAMLYPSIIYIPAAPSFIPSKPPTYISLEEQTNNQFHISPLFSMPPGSFVRISFSISVSPAVSVSDSADCYLHLNLLALIPSASS